MTSTAKPSVTMGTNGTQPVVDGDPTQPIGGVPGAPSVARAQILTTRVVGGRADAVTMTAPFTGQPIVSLPQASDAEARVAFDVARQAQRSWAATPVAERQEFLGRLMRLILDYQDEALDLIQVESGKSRMDAYDEVAGSALAASYYARTAAKHLGARRRAGVFPLLTKTTELRHPRGVVGIITPWNYPLVLTAMDVLPALAAGNAVVHKPDNQTALSALWLHELAAKAGLPDGVWQVVLGRGSVIGQALIDESDYFAFTGSTATGKQLAGQVAQRLRGFSMELGGKNPMIVLPDAKVDSAAAGAVTACFANAGQICVGVERIYVHESQYEDFCRALAAKTASLRLGAALDYSAEVGSLTSAGQLATTTEHVEDARRKGAEVLTGGRPRPDIGPLFYEPTVLTGVTPDMKAYAEETFGPVVSVYSYSDVDEAITRANDTEYGLNASVWTISPRFGREVAARIRAGTVNVNEGFAASFGSIDAPMGGFGESGVGRRNGADGIQRFTEVQTIALQRGLKLRPFKGMPAKLWAALLSRGVKVLHQLRR